MAGKVRECCIADNEIKFAPTLRRLLHPLLHGPWPA
jgi:hypothetical protein